jgi:metal-responsive CopG/Arc/MetJ family transcriptional regulator
MSNRAVKIAVTVDPDVLARAERLRRATGESRSALVTRALAELLQPDAHRRRVARYVLAYRERPESAAEVEAARALAAVSLAALPWTEEP